MCTFRHSAKVVILILLYSASFQCMADMLVHHHIHNFHVNFYAPDKPGYAEPHEHALAMGYSMITRGKPPDKKYSALGIIKLHSSIAAPMRIDTKNARVWYHLFYSGKHSESLIRKGYKVSKWYPIDNTDLQNILTYSCQKKHIDIHTLKLIITNVGKLKDYFWIRWNSHGQINLIANWQDPSVVSDLANKTLLSLKDGGEQAIFFDGLGIGADRQCANSINNETNYSSWNAGKLKFLKMVQDGLGKTTPIFANIWNPYKQDVSSTVLKWYKDKKLRLDHYYLESGENQIVNGVDPGTGKPAYVTKDGFLPASIVSLDTIYGFFGNPTSGRKLRYNHNEYEHNHKDVAIAAALQGSWFGWYGEDNVDQQYSQNGHLVKVYNNAMQLLRAIPGWENLNHVLLNKRKYDSVTGTYDSPDTHISNDVIYSRHFAKKEIYAVFNSTEGSVDLSDSDQVDSIWITNDLFVINYEDDVSGCFIITRNTVSLKCNKYIGIGVRIKLK